MRDIRDHFQLNGFAETGLSIGSTNAPWQSSYSFLLNIDEIFFLDHMFGQRDEWSCEFQTLRDDCTADEVEKALNDPNLLCCVVEHKDTHWDLIEKYYKCGGFVVYFGYEGVFNAPDMLNKTFGVQWKFSSYMRHEFELTPVGIELLGDAITEQQYSKSNMFSAPKNDRILVAKKCRTLEEYMREYMGLDVDNFTEDDYAEFDADARIGFSQHIEEMENQAPLLMHTNPTHGGKIAYLGFVNDDGNIPKFVRALLTGIKTQS